MAPTDTVLIGIEEYNALMTERELLASLAAAERDVEEGRVAPMEQTLDALRAELTNPTTSSEGSSWSASSTRAGITRR